ncbi:hypothetical protein QFZ89_006311 [Paraburkholderia youngii]
MDSSYVKMTPPGPRPAVNAVVLCVRFRLGILDPPSQFCGHAYFIYRAQQLL